MATPSNGSSVVQEEMLAARAIGVIRRSLHPAVRCSTMPRSSSAFIEDPRDVEASFRHAHERMIEIQGSGLMIAFPGMSSLTRHERCLVKATAAAQAEDDELVDNYLVQVAPRKEARPHLARAVAVLATNLAIAGHWFLDPILPAAALPIARLRGLDLHAQRVAWPSIAGGSRLRGRRLIPESAAETR
ncbi:MAG TPA: hypothetical protein VMF67_03780 [Rhizomicrobium sp.]|nr:hypothetical protein [Rhizomicrobium sp.]